MPETMAYWTPAFFVTTAISLAVWPWHSAPITTRVSLYFSESSCMWGRLAMHGGHWTPQPSSTTALPVSLPMVTEGPLMALPQAKSRRSKDFSFLSAAKAGRTRRAVRRVRRRMVLSDTRLRGWQVQLGLSKGSLREKRPLRRADSSPGRGHGSAPRRSLRRWRRPARGATARASSPGGRTHYRLRRRWR